MLPPRSALRVIIVVRSECQVRLTTLWDTWLHFTFTPSKSNTTVMPKKVPCSKVATAKSASGFVTIVSSLTLLGTSAKSLVSCVLVLYDSWTSGRTSLGQNKFVSIAVGLVLDRSSCMKLLSPSSSSPITVWHADGYCSRSNKGMKWFMLMGSPWKHTSSTESL